MTSSTATAKARTHMNDNKVFRRATCATCGGKIEEVQLVYGGRSVGRGWIHKGLENALGAQTRSPHHAVPAKAGRKDKPEMATARKASKAATKPVTKTGRSVAQAQGSATTGSKSETMRAMFLKGHSVAEVAKATDSHYSFAHGVMRRMVAAGDLKANATQPRAAKAPAKSGRSAKQAAPARQTAAARQQAAKAGRPSAARRQANRKATTPAEE